MTAKARDRQAILGIDIGGSCIKGAPVDVERGELLADRRSIETPNPACPEAVAGVIAELVGHFQWSGAVGCAFPAVIKCGVVLTAANVDKSWIGADGRELLERHSGCEVTLLNDADAAGMAEMRFGAGRGRSGLVIMLTLGTGIGSALFIDGRLVPNTELGHLILDGQVAETRASGRVRTEEALSWEDWATRLDEYLCYVENLLNPDLFILGGGVSAKHEQFMRYLSAATPVVPAEMRNDAGIVGAALAVEAMHALHG
ncbi:MAG: ROK family protein [Acidobacteriota bacterium]